MCSQLAQTVFLLNCIFFYIITTLLCVPTYEYRIHEISIKMCIRDRLRRKGSLPATFYVLTRVKYLILTNKVS